MKVFRKPPSDRTVRVFGTCGIVLASLSLIVHLLTFLPVPPPLAWAFVIHAAIFVPFGTMVLLIADHLQRSISSVPWFSWRKIGDARLALYQRITRLTPPSQAILCIGVFAYGLINFGIFLSIDEPSRRFVVRGFSGHWLVFSTVSAVYLLTVEPQLRSESAKGADVEAYD